jgi:GntR family transcriptional regulator of vanillate catabolism
VCWRVGCKNFGRARLKRRAEKDLQHCIQETEKLFNETDEFGDTELERYHHFNVIFHDTIIEGAQNVALIQALAKNNQLPMASAQAITYDQTKLCRNIAVCTMRIYSIVRFSMHWYIVRQGVLKL